MEKCLFCGQEIAPIVKVQISDHTNRSLPQMLVYDKSRQYTWEQDVDKQTAKVFGYKGGMVKQYWYAKLPKKKGLIRLIKLAPEQDW